MLPRVWLISSSGNTLVQVQNDRTYFNWRSRVEQDQYPRYVEIIGSAKEYFETFVAFVRESGLGEIMPTECELTYNNIIPKGQGWENLEDIGSVMPDVSWRGIKDRFLPAPRGMAWQATFPLPDNKGRLDVKLRSGQKKSDSLPALLLELSAHGLGEDKSLVAVWNWFEVAHEWIVRGFADLTAKEIQNTVWEREK